MSLTPIQLLHLARIRPQQPATGPADPSLLKQAGSGFVSGLAAVGNVLDLPGSMIRDTLVGKNPFDQWLTPTSAENRTEGREVLTQFGMRKNKETGWVPLEDPGEFGRDVLGFAAEVALDPLSYLTFGANALTKSGRLATKAGLMGGVKHAGRRLHKGVPELAKMGRREATARLGIGDILTDIRVNKTEKAFTTAVDKLKNAGFKGNVDDLIKTNAPLSGSIGAKVPFLGSATFGTGGRLTLATSKHMDRLGTWASNTAIGRAASQLFEPAAMGIGTERGRNAARNIHGASPAVRAESLEFTGKWMQKLHADGKIDATDLRKLQRVTEGFVSGETPEVMIKLVEEARPILKQAQVDDALMGFSSANLVRRGELEGPMAAANAAIREAKTELDELIDVGLPKQTKVNKKPGKGLRKELKAADKDKYTDSVIDRMTGQDALDILEPIRLRNAHTAAAGKVSKSEATLKALQKEFDATEGEILEYWPRFMRDIVKSAKIEQAGVGKSAVRLAIKKGGSRPVKKPGGGLVPIDPSQIHREPVLMNVKGGTDRVEDILQNEAIEELIKGPPGGSGATAKEVGAAIEGIYPGAIKPETLEAFGNYMIGLPPDVRGLGVFTDPLTAFDLRMNNHAQRHMAANYVMEEISDGMLFAKGGAPEGVVRSDSLHDVFTSMGQTDTKAAARTMLAKEAGKDIVDITDDEIAKRLAMHIDGDEAASFAKLVKWQTSPEPINKFLSGLDSATNFTKAWLTGAWPAFHMRNFISGQFQNSMGGMWSPTSVNDARVLYSGGVIKDAKNISVLKNKLIAEGMEVTDAAATDMLRREIRGWDLIRPKQGIVSDVVGGDLKQLTQQNVVKNFVGDLGGHESSIMGAISSTAYKAVKSNPMDIHKVRGVQKRQVSEFGLIAAGEDVGDFTEAMNRIAPLIKQLREGVDIEYAVQKIKAAQVDYTARSFTPFERNVLKRAFPFYSFSSRMVPHTLQALWKRPGGRLAQTLRASRAGRDDSKVTPSHISEGLSIPWGEGKDGSDRYITGLGLMHEDAMPFIGPFAKALGGDFEVKDLAGELLSRTNPLPKGILEFTTGKSFFQRGPMGMRELRDSDPTMGRLRSNFGVMMGKENERYPQPLFGSRGLETFTSNTPLSRILTTAKGVTDNRKEGWIRAVNALTGVKISDVSEAARSSVLRQQLNALVLEKGGRTYTKEYFSKELKASLSPEELKEVEAIEAALREGERKRKAQKKAAAK